MKTRKIRAKSKTENQVTSRDIRERLNLIDQAMGLKLQTLDYIFAGTKDNPEEFHQLYVQPLLEAGLSLEDSFTLLVDGVLRPN